MRYKMMKQLKLPLEFKVARYSFSGSIPPKFEHKLDVAINKDLEKLPAQLRGLHDPTKSFLIQKLLTALSRRQPVDIRLPVTRPVLHELVRALSFTNSSAFQRSLFSALFLVAFYGLFRIGELTAKSNRFASSVVQFGNLTFLSRNGCTHVAKITISEYKHNTSRRPFDILIAREVSSAFCPVLALIQYCELRGSSPGPLFCHADQSPILTHQFNVELQRCLAYCGLDTSLYESHSFRIGGICHAADRGYSDANPCSWPLEI